MSLLAALPPHADPVQIILNGIVSQPLISAGVGLLLLLNVLHWMFKPAKRRKR